MIDSKFAAQQLERLAGLNFFPKGAGEKAALKELRLALECAASDAIGKRVVDDWLRNEADAPKPAQLRRAAYDENGRFEKEEAAQYKPPAPREIHCYRCKDFGLTESIHESNLRSVASYCDCSMGSQRRIEAHGPETRCAPPKNRCPDCTNAARRKLIALGNRLRINPAGGKDAPMRNVGEVYLGEF